MATPLQHDVKRFLSATVKHGTHKRLACALGVSRGDVSRRFSPNDEDRKLAIAERLEEARQLCLIDPVQGELLRHYIDGLFESWLNPSRPQSDITELTCKVNKETAELVEVRLKNQCEHAQLKEALDVVSAASQVAREIQGQIARKGAQVAKDSGFLPLRRKATR